MSKVLVSLHFVILNAIFYGYNIGFYILVLDMYSAMQT